MNEKNNSKRYFSIQIGSQEVNGTPLIVDQTKSPTKCIEDLTDAYKIKYVKGKNSHYLFFADSQEPLLKATIEKNGDLKISDNKQNIFLNHINEEEAYGMIKNGKK
jgi:hypothetical protein